MNIFSNTRFAVLLCGALLLGATTASAQKPIDKVSQKTSKSAPRNNKALLPINQTCKPQNEVHKKEIKTTPFHGIISGAILKGDIRQKSAKRADIKANAASVADIAQKPSDISMDFCYTKEGSIVMANNVYIQMVMGEEPALRIRTLKDKEWVTATIPVCKVAPRLCEMTTEYQSVLNTKDPTVQEKFVSNHYYRTDDIKDIQGIKATCYYMLLEDLKIPVWVDESTSTDGMAWPYIGLTHTVLGGLFFMPVEDFESTMMEFEAQKTLPLDKAQNIVENMEKNFDKDEKVTTEAMMGLIRETAHR